MRGKTIFSAPLPPTWAFCPCHISLYSFSLAAVCVFNNANKLKRLHNIQNSWDVKSLSPLNYVKAHNYNEPTDLNRMHSAACRCPVSPLGGAVMLSQSVLLSVCVLSSSGSSSSSGSGGGGDRPVDTPHSHRNSEPVRRANEPQTTRRALEASLGCLLTSAWEHRPRQHLEHEPDSETTLPRDVWQG